MKQIDILKAYDELLTSGYTKDQAKAQLRLSEGIASDFDKKLDRLEFNIEKRLDTFATKQDLQLLKNELKIVFAWELGIVVLAVLVLPALGKYVYKFI